MKLIFFLSINRSGTNLILNELSRSPDILICPEADILVNLLLINQNRQVTDRGFQRVKSKLTRDYKFINWGLNISTLNIPDSGITYFDVFIIILTEYLSHLKSNAKVIIFRAERLFQLLDELSRKNIKKYKIQIIYLIRDIRAIYASQKNIINPDTKRRMSQNPIRTVKYWKWYIESFKKERPFPCEIIRYEDFILEYDRYISWIFHQIGISAEVLQSTGDLFKRLPETHKKIHENSYKKPIISRIDAWRSSLTVFEIACIESLTRDTLNKFHYNLINPHINRFKFYLLHIKWYFFYFMGKIIRNFQYSLRQMIYA